MNDLKDKLKKHRWDIGMLISLLPAVAALIGWNRMLDGGTALTTRAVVLGIAAIAVTWAFVIFFGRKKAKQRKEEEEKEK